MLLERKMKPEAKYFGKICEIKQQLEEERGSNKVLHGDH